MNQNKNHPHWFRSAPLGRDEAVLPAMLAKWATASPDALCVRFDNDEEWSYSNAWSKAREAAAALGKLGIKKGEVVLVWLPNGPALIRAWFGISTLGAVYTPMNIALRGSMIEHLIRNSGASVLIAHHELVERLQTLDLSGLRRIIVCGGDEIEPVAGVSMVSETVLSQAQALNGQPELQPWDIAAVLYTSGTTGLAKGVLVPYAQLSTAGLAAHGYLRATDRIYIFTPLFHTVAMSAVYAALGKGASVHVADSFHARTFWHDIRAAGCNRILGLISSMTSYLAKTLPAGERCPFDFAMMSPITPDTAEFAKAQSFDYFAAYSMTEISVPIISPVNSEVYGSCGRQRDGIECRLVDPYDNDVAPGEVGEMIVRSDLPWTMNVGYLNDPVATAAAWRNGWFHTGDAFRQDEHGNFYFVDRLKDAIRRRGENISSIEVELEIAAFPGITEVAVIGVPTAHGDDDVMAIIATAEGGNVEPATLIEHLAERLPHFAVPRFIRSMQSLPKTSTGKIKKHELRGNEVSADVWDREAHGIALKRTKLS
ncbi:AMP-binding protein [Mesorhizobium sp. Z1-4]|uniref:AMP-binding protein n=1 Tax=Mesorhizobium sp. Z1-4 TaxID=2448478 RepID=UPI0013DF6485|nr:AMP-binding protein [Mesorhizobium sp. Z1-4]